MGKPEEPEYPGPERRRPRQVWRKPISTEGAPVSTGSLFAGILALGESTDTLTSAIIQWTRTRQALLWVYIVVGMMGLTTTIVGGYLALEVTHIFRDVRVYTSPKAIEQQQRDGVARRDFIVVCIDNYNDHRANPAIPLRPECPRP